MIAQNAILDRIGLVLASATTEAIAVYYANPYPVSNDGRTSSFFLFPTSDAPGGMIERGRGTSNDVLDRNLSFTIVSTSDDIGKSVGNLIAGYIALTEDSELSGMLCSQLDDLSISFQSVKAETRLQSASADLTAKYRAKRGTFEIIRRA